MGCYGRPLLHTWLHSDSNSIPTLVPPPRVCKLKPWGQFDSSSWVRSFAWAYIEKSLEILLFLNVRIRATNFSPVSVVLCSKSVGLVLKYLAYKDFTYQPVERYRAIMALMFLGFVDRGDV